MMRIEHLLRKLQPLMPGRVRKWRQSLDLADDTLRDLLGKEITTTAYRKLGDFRDKLLLSIPPKQHSTGSIHLGTIQYESPKWDFTLMSSELMQNLAIFGRSGAGKTNVAFHILEQLSAQGIPFLFFDWKRTARHLSPRLQGKVRIYTPGRSLCPFPFSPFIPPPGLEPLVYVNHVVDVMGDAYTLGDAARSVLQKALRACHQDGLAAPSVGEVIKRVDALPEKERIRGWKVSAIRALETLAAMELAADSATQRAMVSSLLHENSVLELDGLSPSNKKFLLPLLCLWLYYLKLPDPRREQLSLVIFIEEAHHLLYHREVGGESLMSMLLRQCREIGIGIVVIDQHPHLISSAALGNTYTSISLNLKDPKDVNKAAALSLVDSEDKRHLSMLPVGRGVVKLQDRWAQPFVVQFPGVDVQKGALTDEVVAQSVDTLSALSEEKKSPFLEKETRTRSRAADRVLRSDELRFVHDVHTFPSDGVDSRYRRLGVSADRGHKLKQALIGSSILEEEVVQVGRTRRKLLRVSAAARRRVGLPGRDGTTESLTHEYWKRWYAQRFREQGFHVQLEAPRNRGQVDVLATRATESVAIEVETGKSDVVANVRQDLLSGFGRIVVVATDDHALRKVERQLGEAGLLMNRVSVVARDEHTLG